MTDDLQQEYDELASRILTALARTVKVNEEVDDRLEFIQEKQADLEARLDRLEELRENNRDNFHARISSLEEKLARLRTRGL